MIEFSTWVIPLSVTISSFLTAYLNLRSMRGDPWSSFYGAMTNVIIYGLATIISLVAWLLWALL